MQNHEGGIGEDYGPENEELPIPDASQQSRPVFDNEAIQGISDLSQREDAQVIQQSNSESPVSPDGGMGLGYQDSSMPQAYTGETSKGQVQEEVEKSGDEATMNQQHYSLENKEQSQEKIGTSLTSNHYNTEPAEDCLCPKKGKSHILSVHITVLLFLLAYICYFLSWNLVGRSQLQHW